MIVPRENAKSRSAWCVSSLRFSSNPRVDRIAQRKPRIVERVYVQSRRDPAFRRTLQLHTFSYSSALIHTEQRRRRQRTKSKPFGV